MMWGFGGIWMILIWVGIILAIVWAVQGGTASPEPRQRRAIDILEERYARGEIDGDDYFARLSELEQH